MSFRNSITIVASPRPRVGKTLLARLLTDFHSQEGRSVAAFDLNSGERTLAQFLPERVVTATIRDINGQMALFDRLVADDDATKVIDLGHESFESFFAVAHQIGFVEEARRRSIAVAILFMVTPDQTSVEAYRNLRARFARATLAPVHNEIAGTRAASRQIHACRWRRRDWCICRCWRRACADTSTRRHSHSQIRIWATRSVFRLIAISNCSAGYVEFIWNSGNSICAFYWPILQSSIRIRSQST